MSVQNVSAFCPKMSSLFHFLIEICVISKCKEYLKVEDYSH